MKKGDGMGEIYVKEREVVIPGQTLAKGMDLLPGYGTYRYNDEIVSKVTGLVKLKERIISVIPLSGKYVPRPGDGVIGIIEDVQPTFWNVNINSPYIGILLLGEAVKEYVDVTKTDISKYYDIGEVIYARVLQISKSGIVTLSMNDPKARKLRGGKLVRITPYKVPRVIGKEGSMIELIKEKTQCQIIVGQNGVIWIKGKNEALATKAILLIEKESHILGLTEKVSKLLEGEAK
ncbi:MAG TPA: RNA-binding protein [Nanoarchaeota archaeon]|nr:RNA-binding protein [Nanoarchaeota archaeon]